MLSFLKQRTPYLALAAIIIVSLTSRVALSIILGDEISEVRGGTYDQISYDSLAQRVNDGHGFSFATDSWPYAKANQETAFWSYLYTVFLSVIYRLFGHHPLIARLIQAVLVGILTPWLTYRITKRMFNRRTGLIAALLTTIYAYFILYAASLMTEALYITSILWAFDIASRIDYAFIADNERGVKSFSRKDKFLAVELGLAMGLSLLLRQVIVVFWVVLIGWLLWAAWRHNTVKIAVKQLMLACFVFLLVVALPTAYYYKEFNRLSLPSNNAGFAFFWSNHPIYETQFEAVLSDAHGVTYQELIPNNLRQLNEADLDKALLELGFNYILEDPVRYAQLSLSRVPIYFLFWPTPDSSLLSNIARISSFGILLPSMLFGLGLSILEAKKNIKSGAFRTEKNELTAYRIDIYILFWLFILMYSLVHILSWANVRYRLPIDSVLIIFAAAAIEWIICRWSIWNKEQTLSMIT